MIEIDDKIVSADLLRECFACDIAKCKGICCVEGNAGAPLEAEEVGILEREYAAYKPYMTPEGIEAVERQGFMVIDEDGDLTTPLVGDAECAYTYQENGITLCAIEKAWLEGKTAFRKPISCHLYPIRVVRFRTVRQGSTTTAGRSAPRRANAAAGWESRSTRRCANRSCAVSARNFTRRWKPPKNLSDNNKIQMKKYCLTYMAAIAALSASAAAPQAERKPIRCTSHPSRPGRLRP